MPPKPKFTKEEMTAAALDFVSKNGLEELTTRRLAQVMGSSARPIFTLFDTMDDLVAEVRRAAMERFSAYAQRELTGHSDMPELKRFGMRMIMFAMREPNLYRLLFMKEKDNASNFYGMFGELGETANICIDVIVRDYHMEEERAKALFEQMWIYTYGVATLCATGMCHFSAAEISELLTREFTAVMLLFKSGQY